MGSAGGEEVGQTWQGLNHVAARRIHHALLRGGIGRGRCGQFAGRRVKEGRLVSQQLQSQGHAGAQCEAGGKPVQCGICQPFGEFQGGDLAHYFCIHRVLGADRCQ